LFRGFVEQGGGFEVVGLKRFGQWGGEVGVWVRDGWLSCEWACYGF